MRFFILHDLLLLLNLTIVSFMPLPADLLTLSSPHIIIIRGIPGSGKSTLAKKLLQTMPDAVHCEADHYFRNEQGEYHYDVKKIGLAHQWCQRNIRMALHEGHSVVVSNTTIRLWELAVLLDIAAEFNIDTQVIHCLGTFVNTHGVPEDIVQQMASNYETYADETNHLPA